MQHDDDKPCPSRQDPGVMRRVGSGAENGCRCPYPERQLGTFSPYRAGTTITEQNDGTGSAIVIRRPSVIELPLSLPVITIARTTADGCQRGRCSQPTVLPVVAASAQDAESTIWMQPEHADVHFGAAVLRTLDPHCILDTKLDMFHLRGIRPSEEEITDMRTKLVRQTVSKQWVAVLRWQRRHLPYSRVYTCNRDFTAKVEGMSTLSALVRTYSTIGEWCCWGYHQLVGSGVGFFVRRAGHFARIVRVDCRYSRLARGMICTLVLQNASSDPVQEEYTIQLTERMGSNGIPGVLAGYPDGAGGYVSGPALVTGFDFPE